MSNTIPFPAEESGTAKLLRAACKDTAQSKTESVYHLAYRAFTATTEEDRIYFLKAARDDINGALVAMGE